MPTYTKFLTRYLPLSLLALLIAAVAFLYFVSTSEDLIWVAEAKAKKDNNIKAAAGRKIVINSGSNALFGIRSKDMEDALHMPAYNMALHAGLGLDFVLAESKEVLNSGDIVILPLEHELLTNDTFSWITKLAFDFYRRYERSDVGRIPPGDQARFLLQTNLFDALVNTATAKLKNPAQIGYKSANINDHGDQMNHPETMTGLLRSLKPIELPKTLQETTGLYKLSEFRNWCEEHQVTLYYTYPNMMYFKEYEDEKYRAYFAFLDEYMKEHRIEVLLNQYDSFFDESLMYDTYYHLNDEGMTLRTQRLIAELKQRLPSAGTAPN